VTVYQVTVILVRMAAKIRLPASINAATTIARLPTNSFSSLLIEFSTSLAPSRGEIEEPLSLGERFSPWYHTVGPYCLFWGARYAGFKAMRDRGPGVLLQRNAILLLLSH
jgi:hypothetical protein